MEVRKHKSLNEEVLIEEVQNGDVFEYGGKYLMRCMDSSWDCNDAGEIVATHFNAVDLADGRLHIFGNNRYYDSNRANTTKVRLVGSHCEVYSRNNP